jgi:hypothetical protein
MTFAKRLKFAQTYRVVYGQSVVVQHTVVQHAVAQICLIVSHSVGNMITAIIYPQRELSSQFLQVNTKNNTIFTQLWTCGARRYDVLGGGGIQKLS